MLKYIKKLSWNFLTLFILAMAALINWKWPLYLWLGDTTIYRFIWLGIFFVLLDIFIEVILTLIKEIRLIAETMAFSREIRKLSKDFLLASKVSLPNKLKAEYIAIGSSGIWLIDIKDDGGPVTFNGDDLVQGNVVLKGIITRLLEKSYALADLLKKNLNRDFKVSPVIAFSSSITDLNSVPKTVRGVYISSRKDIISLIENTDTQLIDKNTANEIFKIIKK